MEIERERKIRERAYELWEREGRPEGEERSHWEEAERQVADEYLKRPPEDQSPAHPAGLAPAAPADDGKPVKRRPARKAPAPRARTPKPKT